MFRILRAVWFCLWVVILPANLSGDPPIRLPNGEPLSCIYYFPQWWEPWKSNDDAIRQDFQRLRKMGFNTLLLDHEWSQAIDGNWKWLDRAHRLAKEAGLFIVPWLGVQGWAEIDSSARAQLFQQWYGMPVVFGKNQDGSQGPPPIYQEAIVHGGSQYAIDYLGRYADQALLNVNWNGELRPIISLNVETAWKGCFDETSNSLFLRWLRDHYASIELLNAAWKTAYLDFSQVNPLDKTIFDYSGHVQGKAVHPQAVEDHVEFRSEKISETLTRMATIIRQQYPNVLLLAEVPYQYGSQHPDAISYRINLGVNPKACDYADIVLFRCTTVLNAQETQAMRQRQELTGQKFVLTYRTYTDWDVQTNSAAFNQTVRALAESTAKLGSGFGFYSWNEMVDTHVAYSPTAGIDPTWTAERSERAIALVAALMNRYIFEARLDFEHFYRDVFSPAADNYIVERVNVQKIDGMDITWWQPEFAGQDARLSMRYDFPEPVRAAYLRVNANDALSVWNYGNGIYGSGSVWTSKDNVSWVKLLDAPTPTGLDAFYSYDGFLPESVLGAQALWLQVRMRSEGSNNKVQYLRHSTNNVNDCFDLKVQYSTNAPPLIQRFQLAMPNALELRVYGSNGPVRIEYATNLNESILPNRWLNLAAIQITNSPMIYVDTSASNSPKRFYRAIREASNPDTNSLAGMTLIPTGSFTMGDTFNEGDGDELPTHVVSVGAFSMDKYEVTKGLWDEVLTWAVAHGYGFNNSGLGKAANHPVHSVTWWDVVKWCNARSEKEGRVPAYYTDAAQATVYRTGQVNVENGWVKWNAGYRLPTEAEWEKAARGGASGHRFPWSNGETITHSQANYFSTNSYSYDISPTHGFNPSCDNDPMPYTSPVGSFAPNAYGLYDMAGNLWEWCWDWSGSYTSGSQTDPRGGTSGSSRMMRGGCWYNGAFNCRVADRFSYTPDVKGDGIGFRAVLAPEVLNPPSSPTANPASNVTSNGFTANWGSVSGATGYWLDVSTNSSFSSFVSGYQNLDVGNTTVGSVSGLSVGTTYYYRIRAYNASGTSGNSGTISVTTSAGPPSPPTAHAASNVGNNQFRANWGAASGATGYRLDVSTDRNFSGLENRNVGNSTICNVSGRNASTTYYYRVRAYNNGGDSENSETIGITTSPKPPLVPTAYAASNVSSYRFTANWSSVSGATSYRLYVSTSSFFTNYASGYQGLDVGNATSCNVSSLNPGTTYYYFVSANLAAGSSDTISVTTYPRLPSAPTAYPASGVTSSGFTANWSSVMGATNYRLEVFSWGTNIYFDDYVGQLTSYTVSSLGGAGQYHYRVRAYNAGGLSAYSNTIDFWFE